MKLGPGAQIWPEFWGCLYFLGPSSEGHLYFSFGDVDSAPWAGCVLNARGGGKEGAGLPRARGVRLSLLSVTISSGDPVNMAHAAQTSRAHSGYLLASLPQPPALHPQAHTHSLCTPRSVPDSPTQPAGEAEAPKGLVWQTHLSCCGHLC